MNGFYEYLTYKLLTMIAKFQKPINRDWRGLRISKTIQPDRKLSITDWGKHILTQNRKPL